MTELDNIYWATNNEYWTIQDKIINQLIYQPARGYNRTFYYNVLYNRTFYYNVLYYYYRHKILSFKSGTVLDTLDDIRLFTKKYNNPWIWCFNPPKIPITFEEFINNRSLSRYIQKASKEITYGNSNRNRNNSCKQ